MSRLSSTPAASCAAAALAFIATGSLTFADTADVTTAPADASASSSGARPAPLKEIQVTAQRLNEARSTIETQTGASTYTIDSQAIAAMPGGENAQLNQVLLQAPDVVQDSFGQIHVRADHNDLQYRLERHHPARGHQRLQPDFEPVADFLLEVDHRRAAGGVRPANRGDHRLSTNSGLLQPGGEVSVYGGSHGTFQPSAEYGGSDGNFTYYVTGDYKQDNLGIESPDGSSNPLHDHTTQGHAFAYLEDIIDSEQSRCR